MQSEEQRLIDGLFGRLKDAETKTGPRDLQAEQQINQHIREQPSAPYYMAQAMIIQEAALKQMDQRVKELEAQVAQLQQTANGQQSSGGFLAGLFGGGSRTPSPREQYQAQQQNTAAWNNAQQGATRNSSSLPMPNRSRRRLHAPAASWEAPCKRRRASLAAWCWPTC